jgi:pimeloyl-ACP methyl ester carboxylesterase
MDDRPAVRAAMERLLRRGGSRARSVPGDGAGSIHHLEEGAGPPVVLLHGGTGGGANWFRLLAPLARRYRVLAPDLPGFGLSPHARPAAPLGIAAATALQDWLAANGIGGATVVGTSFGGLAAIRLAQRAPDRVDRLLLLDSAGLGPGIHPLIRLAAVPGLTRAGVAPTRAGTAWLLRSLLTAGPDAMGPADASALIDYLFASARAAGVPYLATTLRLFASVRGQRELVRDEELRALPQAVAVMWGGRDRLLPVAHAWRAAGLRGVRPAILDGIGHSPNWERPDAVVAAVDDLIAGNPA